MDSRSGKPGIKFTIGTGQDKDGDKGWGGGCEHYPGPIAAKRMILDGALVGENPCCVLAPLIPPAWDLPLSCHCVQDLLQVQRPWER